MGFSAGYFSAKELLKKEDYENLTKLEDTSFFNYLKTKGYSNYDNIDKLFLNEHLKIKNDLLKNANSNFSNFFYILYDSLNTKQIYKAIKLNKGYYYHPLGKIGENAIYDALKHQDYQKLEEEDKFIFYEINKNELSFKETSDLIDNLFITKSANYAYNEILKEFLKTEITLRNILVFLRSKKLNQKATLVSNGYFELNDVKDLNEEQFKVYLSKLFLGNLKDVSLNDFNELEKELKIKLFEIIKPLTYEDEGIIVSYVYKKFIELENLKSLFYEKNIKEIILL